MTCDHVHSSAVVRTLLLTARSDGRKQRKLSRELEQVKAKIQSKQARGESTAADEKERDTLSAQLEQATLEMKKVPLEMKLDPHEQEAAANYIRAQKGAHILLLNVLKLFIRHAVNVYVRAQGTPVGLCAASML